MGFNPPDCDEMLQEAMQFGPVDADRGTTSLCLHRRAAFSRSATKRPAVQCPPRETESSSVGPRMTRGNEPVLSARSTTGVAVTAVASADHVPARFAAARDVLGDNCIATLDASGPVCARHAVATLPHRTPRRRPR